MHAHPAPSLPQPFIQAKRIEPMSAIAILAIFEVPQPNRSFPAAKSPSSRFRLRLGMRGGWCTLVLPFLGYPRIFRHSDVTILPPTGATGVS